MFVNTAMEDEEAGPLAEPLRRKAATEATINMSKKSATRMRRVSSILRKKNDSLTLDDRQVLEENAELVEEYHKRRQKRAVWQSRKTEQEDTAEVLQAKCEELAQAIHDSEFLVAYTGAGISTAASIPDYRGPNGIWTLLQKGQDIGHHDLSAAEPTLTHMALSALYQQGIVHHVVSQNCDGLHLRSGLPKSAMSEVHGNMYIEVCIHCVPAREYVRTMDVTEKTSTFKHTTGRRCYRCGEPLIDTIVHFGERGRLRWPLNWQGACQAANACDTILCLGSSLKVLKKYPWLWQMGRSPKKRPRLYIVNLQWTPKDKDATLKINGKCDEVMARVMKVLGYKLPRYSKASDPIFTLATPFHPAEANTASRHCLVPPQEGDEEEEEEEEEEEDEEEAEVDVNSTEAQRENEEERWGKRIEGSGEESKKRKLDSVEDEVKEEKCDVKEESKSDVKPINGLHLTLGSERFPLCHGGGGVSGVKYLKTENSEGESKPVLMTTKVEVKEEVDPVPDVKDEVEDAKDADNLSDAGSQEFDPLHADVVAACGPKGEGEQQGTTDEEEVKSEPMDSDEDFHASDMEGEPWEHTPDTDVASPKSSASCCSDSESSEKGEDCNTEDSDAPDARQPEASQMDYFKLAYASTNVQMARQGQALLKHNDFYGTGLCIRSFVNYPKSGERSKAAASSDGQVLKGPRRVRSQEASGEASVPSSPQPEEEMPDVSSLPSHCQSSEALSSSDSSSECPPCECGSAVVLSSSSGASDIPSSCSKCKSFPTESVGCVVPGTVSVISSVKVEVEGPDGEAVGESHVGRDAQLPSVGVITEDSLGQEDVVVKASNVICHKGLDLKPKKAGDGSFLLRTRIVDGIITTTCVESLAKEESGTGIPYLSAPTPCKVPVACSSQSEVARVAVPCLSLHQKALMPPNKSAIYIDKSVSEAHVKAITEHLQCRRSRTKFSSELSTAESAELKSIWYQSFCGPNKDSSLSALTVMMEMNDCNLRRDLSQGLRPTGADLFSKSEKSSSVILKNICAEALNDSAAQQRNSAKKLKGSDDENVKCIWFWGFDSSAEGKDKAALAESSAEGDPPPENGDCHPGRRVTRSRTRASCEAANQPPPEEEGFKCHCSGSNPELCRIASLRPSRGRCDETVQRARDIIRRRRTYNYRRYEPVFEKKLASLTYERTRSKRKSKFEMTAAAAPAAPAAAVATTASNSREEEEEEQQQHEAEAKEEEQKGSDGEECREKDEKEERKIVPGWYGKGLRKGMKKKSRV